MTPLNEDPTETGVVAPLQPHEQALLDWATDGARKAFEADGYCNAALLAMQPGMNWDLLDVNGFPKAVVHRLIEEGRKSAAVAMTCEAWFTSLSALKDSAIGKAIKSGEDVVVMPPRLDANRKESVMIQLYSGKRVICRSAIITRPPTGKPTLGPWRTMDNAHKDCELRPANFGPGGFLASGDVK